MDNERAGRLDAAAQRYARRKWLPDPAMSACDLVQNAWVRALPRLTPDRTEAEQGAYLLRAVNSCAIDAQRAMWRRPRGEYGDWLPSPQRVDDEALGRVALAMVLDDPAPGARLAVLVGAGWSRQELAERRGVSEQSVRKCLWRWRKAQGVVA